MHIATPGAAALPVPGLRVTASTPGPAIPACAALGVLPPSLLPAPAPPTAPSYNITDLVERAVGMPPDLQALAQLGAFIQGRNLSVGDLDSRPESLLYIVDKLGNLQPRAYGIARQSVLFELRMRLVVRAVRAFCALWADATLDHSTVLALRGSLHRWQRMHKQCFAKNQALAFKVHEAASLLAGLHTTQTRTERWTTRLRSAALLGASVASTVLPFLAVHLNTSLGVASSDTSNNDVKAGIVGVDLAYSIVAQTPRPAAWFKAYEPLRRQLHALTASQRAQGLDADALESALSAQLGALPPHRWQRAGLQAPGARRLLLLGTLDIMERLGRRARLDTSVANCLPVLHQILASKHDRALHERAIEVLLTLCERGCAATHLQGNLAEMYHHAAALPGFGAAQGRWQARTTLRQQMAYFM